VSRCPDAQRLSAFVLGELSTADRDAISAHVDGCPAYADVIRFLVGLDLVRRSCPQ
jgi:anti-sigma factor RsiW